jgi:MFS family permease
MSRSTFRLVMLISCAHALVHTFELSLPAVEQMIGDEFNVGTDRTGALGTVWRLPFGLAAMLAGWLADRYGSRLMLIVYLVGCSTTAVLAWWAPSLGVLFGVMFAMGCFASIYHPAGLALISRETTPETRGAALGWHGIIGSLGIAGAPFAAMLVFSTGAVDWRQYYLLLVIPAAIVAMLLGLSLMRSRPSVDAEPADPSAISSPAVRESIFSRPFLILVASGALSGFVYAAFMHFLPRYLGNAGLRPDNWTPESFRNALAAAVLLCAAVGQAIAGRLCRPGRLEKLLVIVFLANVPPLLWMSLAEGYSRFVAACLLALIHFMNQPVYNSLIAQFIPLSRRSVGYGFSNMMCFGIGALGPLCAGLIESERTVYAGLAGVAGLAGLVAVVLMRQVQRNPLPPQ